MDESNIEKQLKKKTELLGGKALKFVSPGTAGVPDRIVLLPGGKIIFVELKAPKKKLRELQKYRKKELERLGFRVEVIDSLDRVKEFINQLIDEVNI